jgi:hypothetical protein
MNLSLQTCGVCKFWDLAGSLGQQGYGRCKARPPGFLREGCTTSAQHICRIGKFARAETRVVQAREQVLEQRPLL